MGVGVFHAKGWWPKSSCSPSKVCLPFRREESGMSREFCRDVPDPWVCSKSLCKKSSCAVFVPYRESHSRLFLDLLDIFVTFSRLLAPRDRRAWETFSLFLGDFRPRGARFLYLVGGFAKSGIPCMFFPEFLDRAPGWHSDDSYILLLEL